MGRKGGIFVVATTAHHEELIQTSRLIYHMLYVTSVYHVYTRYGVFLSAIL